MMRVVSWNLGHQTQERRLHPQLDDALRLLEPDVLVLNEYVHGTTREPFERALGVVGLTHRLVSDRVGKNNQVLVASRSAIQQGMLRGVTTEGGAGESNFLHVTVADYGIQLVGIRVPAYERRAELTSYWQSLVSLMTTMEDETVMFIGDFNADPDANYHTGARDLRALRDRGWRIPAPEGTHSFKSGTRIDHVAATQGVPPLRARYVTKIGDIMLCGAHGEAISDHAPIVVDVDCEVSSSP